MHVLKRSAGIGSMEGELEERVEELAEALMVLVTATGFLEVSYIFLARLFPPFDLLGRPIVSRRAC